MYARGVVILLSTGSPAHLEAALDQGIADLRRRNERP